MDEVSAHAPSKLVRHSTDRSLGLLSHAHRSCFLGYQGYVLIMFWSSLIDGIGE